MRKREEALRPSHHFLRFLIKCRMINTINTIQTITSPNITINAVPPATIAQITTTVNASNKSTKIVNNNIFIPPY